MQQHEHSQLSSPARDPLADPETGNALRASLLRLRGDPARLPQASVIIPVNAQGDLERVLVTIEDVARYAGRHTLEVLLLINNYPPDQPPQEIDLFQSFGIRVVGIPSVRKPGENVPLTARIAGLRAAASELALLFDSDCRIPNPTALFDWYIQKLQAGAEMAYAPVGFYELPPTLAIKARMALHYLSRWFKRVVLRIPTNRGSSYAVRRSRMLDLYERGMLAVDLNVGPTIQAEGGEVVYSGAKELLVLTSGRKIEKGWIDLLVYSLWRLRYNWRMLPVGTDLARRRDQPKK
jgi:hypothetical protein